MKRAAFFLFLFFGAQAVSAQQDTARIRKQFSSIVYFENSSIIQFARNERDGKSHGLGIEFDTLGRPRAIGRYRHGCRNGIWLYSDGSSVHWNDGSFKTGSRPGCGTGVMKAQKDFMLLYEELLK